MFVAIVIVYKIQTRKLLVCFRLLDLTMIPGPDVVVFKEVEAGSEAVEAQGTWDRLCGVGGLDLGLCLVVEDLPGDNLAHLAE